MLKFYGKTITSIPLWMCECECGNVRVVRASNLKSGNSKSCGQCRNKYDLSGDYGIGWTESGDAYYFDLEDYEKIKNYKWSLINSDKYIGTNGDKDIYGYHPMRLHRLIMGLDETQSDIHIDHINHNVGDNRKCNLRYADNSTNHMNQKIRKDNISGYTGIRWLTSTNKWRARITYKQKIIDLGCYSSLEDAIKARKEAEEKYFGEYRYKGMT